MMFVPMEMDGDAKCVREFEREKERRSRVENALNLADEHGVPFDYEHRKELGLRDDDL